MVRVKASAQT